MILGITYLDEFNLDRNGHLEDSERELLFFKSRYLKEEWEKAYDLLDFSESSDYSLELIDMTVFRDIQGKIMSQHQIHPDRLEALLSKYPIFK